jgi:pilus assembly protein CpaC
LAVALLVFLGLATGAEAPLAQPTGLGNVGTVEAPSYINLVQGKSLTLLVDGNVNKLDIGEGGIATARLLGKRQGKREVYLLGKKIGSTNLILWSKSGQSTVVDVIVGMDVAGLQSKLQLILPTEKDIRVTSAADSLVLSGTVADTVKVDKAVALAEIYSGKKVVNFLSAGAPQQVMLEVKVAEVSKNLLDKLGAQFSVDDSTGSWTASFLSNFLSSPALAGLVSAQKGATSIDVDAQKDDDIVKILAEPNIMAISGQEGSFLAGGKILIPVAQGGLGGVTLEEREFGVGLRFTPTVLEGGRINLKVAPEVSELADSRAFQNGGTSALLPVITTRRAGTTVQLHDGQSFAIAGLIRNNVTEQVSRFPILGEIPILGALFRSSSFARDKTELLFVITPRLVKPLPANYALPTDRFIEPSRSEFFLEGKMEGKPKEARAAEGTSEAAADPSAPAEPKAEAGGFEMK